MKHNQKGSTMLVTMVLMALFGIMLAGFHMAVISITARIDDTYSEKQTYLYARSAVTALAEDIKAKSAAYTTALEEYQAEVDDSEEELELAAPEKDILLAAMDTLKVGDAPLPLSNVTFPKELVDDYTLDMTIERVLDGDAEAYKLSATATIEEISDTVSILLQMSDKEVTLEQTITTTIPGTTTPPPTPTVSNTVPEISGSMKGIYADFGLQFTGGGSTFKEVEGDPQIVSGTNVVYDGKYKWDLDKSDITFMSQGNMTLDGSPEEKTIKHCNFYVDGDLTIKGKVKFEESCNLYVSGNVIVDSSDVTFDNVKIWCNEYKTNKTPSKSNTTIKEVTAGEITTAEIAKEMAKIPPRHRPTWVDEADAGTRNDVFIVEAGETKTVTESKNYIWVKAGGTLVVDKNEFQGEIYGDPPTTAQYNAIANGNNTIAGLKSQLAVVQLNQQKFLGTITAPVIQVTTSDEFYYTYKKPSGNIPPVGEYDNYIDNSTSSGSTGTTSPSGGFSGIYTDTPIDFQWYQTLFPNIESGTTVVCNQNARYDLYENVVGGEKHPKIMNDGDLTLNIAAEQRNISNLDFYVDGDLLFTSNYFITFNQCNFYVTGKIKFAVNTGGGDVTLNQCTAQCNGWEITSSLETEINNGSTLVKNATLSGEDLNLPQRPKPAWVTDVEQMDEADIITYSKANASANNMMEAGKVYRVEGFGQWSDQGLNTVGEATPEQPITIIVGAGLTGIYDSCGENVRFLVEPGGHLFINAEGYPTAFHADVYSYEAKVGEAASLVTIQKAKNFEGTYILQKLTMESEQPGGCSYGGGTPVTGGGSTGDTTTTTTNKVEVTYNLYEDYLYIRG